MGNGFFEMAECEAEIMYTGAPGEYQKFTIQYNDDNHRARYFLKVSEKDGGIEGLKHEIAALKQIEVMNGAEHIEVPQAVRTVSHEGFFGFVQKSILQSERTQATFLPEDISFLAEMYGRFEMTEIRVEDYLKEIQFDASNVQMAQFRGLLRQAFSESVLLAASHGDYIPWNRFIAGHIVKVIDWETFGFRPLFYDIVYFCIHKAILIDKSPVSSAIAQSRLWISEARKKIKEPRLDDLGTEIDVYLRLCLFEMIVHYSRNQNEGDRVLLAALSEAMDQV